MCLVLLALDSHPAYPVVLAANRDEFYDRPTARAGFWNSTASVLGGRDLKAGGTWLGVSRAGQLAAVTNFRQGEREKPAPRSRGQLVADFLTGSTGAPEYMERVRAESHWYNGFNLIAGDAGGFFYYSNREAEVRRLGPGVYGLSNHLLDTPWPKVAAAKSGFGQLLESMGAELTERLFALLSDRSRPPDDLLPATGVSREWERLLSSAFIASDGYGTRSSTVILIGKDGTVNFAERTFGPHGEPGGEVRFEIIQAP